MDFIFMLTRDDRTVSDALDVLDSVQHLGIRHIGFKDIGTDRATLAQLHDRVRKMGATTYLEVVSTDRAQALTSVRTALDLGVDWLMGGTWIDETVELLRGTPVRYLPFAGRPHGHPTRLGGSPERIADDCRRAGEAGCAGVDLLAYRATDAAPLDLVRAARAATTGRLVVAGSITGTDQIRALAAAGADAFTIGSAAFAGALQPHAGTLAAQLAPVLAAARGCAPVRRKGWPRCGTMKTDRATRATHDRPGEGVSTSPGSKDAHGPVTSRHRGPRPPEPQAALGVGVVVTDGRGHVLLGLHPSGVWELPGGKVDAGESIEAAAVRELAEETTLRADARQADILAILLDTVDGVNRLTAVALVSVHDGTPAVAEPDKIDRWEWHDPHRLPSPLFTPSAQALTTWRPGLVIDHAPAHRYPLAPGAPRREA